MKLKADIAFIFARIFIWAWGRCALLCPEMAQGLLSTMDADMKMVLQQQKYNEVVKGA
jgi:hypothetical protein